MREYRKRFDRALSGAISEIDLIVNSSVLDLMGFTLKKKLSRSLAKIHSGAYLDSGDSDSFVQNHIAPFLNEISLKFLAALPNEYSPILCEKLVKYLVLNFISNLALLRPLGENGRLRVIQDLTDLELSIEQFILNGGSKVTFSQIDNGKLYSELRAVRQMLFWAGFENESCDANDINKLLMRESWTMEVRPSTLLNFLFSYAPSLLSSPHESKSMKVQDYVLKILVPLEGNVTDEGETENWMTVMACCDAYRQRESVQKETAGIPDGDKRVADVLMQVGQDLLRRRKQ